MKNSIFLSRLVFFSFFHFFNAEPLCIYYACNYFFRLLYHRHHLIYIPVYNIKVLLSHLLLLNVSPKPIQETQMTVQCTLYVGSVANERKKKNNIYFGTLTMFIKSTHFCFTNIYQVWHEIECSIFFF